MDLSNNGLVTFFGLTLISQFYILPSSMFTALKKFNLCCFNTGALYTGCLKKLLMKNIL
jgi:hypothetical protein